MPKLAMWWNYRVVLDPKRDEGERLFVKVAYYGDLEDEAAFSVTHDTYRLDPGPPAGIADLNVVPSADTRDELRADLLRYAASVEMPVLQQKHFAQNEERDGWAEYIKEADDG